MKYLALRDFKKKKKPDIINRNANRSSRNPIAFTDSDKRGYEENSNADTKAVIRFFSSWEQKRKKKTQFAEWIKTLVRWYPAALDFQKVKSIK